jgi:hypothetical protein
MINKTKKKISENIRKTLCYAADQTRFFYNFEIIQKKNRFKTGKYIFFYSGNFKKKNRYLSFQKSI